MRAVEDLKWFEKPDQHQIIDGIDVQLRHEPAAETRNRKRLRPNPLAEWELRIGDFRVLYNVDKAVNIVEIQRISEKRRGELYLRGEKEDL